MELVNMEDFVFNLEEGLEEPDAEVTVDREDLEDLIKAYKELKKEREELEYDVEKLKNEREY